MKFLSSTFNKFLQTALVGWNPWKISSESMRLQHFCDGNFLRVKIQSGYRAFSINFDKIEFLWERKDEMVVGWLVGFAELFTSLQGRVI